MNSKKNIYVNGTLAAPLREGVRAMIHSDGGFIYTSLVVEIREVSADCVCFETMNSVYHVSLEPVPFEAALPDKLAMCA